MVTIRCRNVTFERIEAVVIDKDGTLANSESFLKHLGQKRSRLLDAQVPGVQEPLLMAFGLEGDRLNPSGLLAVGSRYENEIAAAAYVAETGRDWLEALQIVQNAFAEADKYLKRKADDTPPYEDALKLLQALASAGLKLGILSSDTPENVQDFVKKYQLAPYLQLQMGVSTGPAKPDPVLFQQACQALEVSPGTTLMIGDTDVDMTMARRAGAAGCIAVRWGETRSIQIADADVAIANFEELQILV